MYLELIYIVIDLPHNKIANPFDEGSRFVETYEVLMSMHGNELFVLLLFLFFVVSCRRC